MKTVGDIINSVRAYKTSDSRPECISVAYGHTRTITKAKDREAVAYAISHRNAVVVFPKRGGYLAYSITLKDRWGPYYGRVGTEGWYSGWSSSIPIDKMDAIDEIKYIKKQGLGKTYIKKGLERELYNLEIIGKL